jgi:hypothetical protein
MVNTKNVFRGSDAKLMLSSDPNNKASPVETEIAKSVISDFELLTVGRATNIEIYVQTDLELFHEIGVRFPTALRPGNVNISGKIGRAYINGALLKALLGKGANIPHEQEPYPQPSFELMVAIEDPAYPGTASALIIDGVKFDDWAFSLPEDDFVMESVTFKGLSISVNDIG